MESSSNGTPPNGVEGPTAITRTKGALPRPLEVETAAPPSTYRDITRSTWIWTACAALNSCNLGYDIGVNTDAIPLLKESMNLSNVEVEFFTGSINLFAMFGAALGAHYVSDKWGRRASFAVAAVSFLIGVLVLTLAPSYTVLLVGRFFVGWGVGVGLALDPLYIAEISPVHHRGQLVTWSEAAINVGITLGFLSGLIFYALDADVAWRCMFAQGALLPVVMLVLLATDAMPESPRWLVRQGRTDEAKTILAKIYPPEHNVNAVIADIQLSLQRENVASRGSGLFRILCYPSPAYRRMLLVGVGMAVAQQLVGIDAIQYYMDFVIEEAGVCGRASKSAVLVFMGLCKLAAVIWTGFYFDTRGRRPLLFWSLGGMTVALLLLALAFGVSPQDDGTGNSCEAGNTNSHSAAGAVLAVVGLTLYLGFFSLGMGPGAWLIPSEVFSLTIRSKAMSIATFGNRLTATLMSSTFLTAKELLTNIGFFLSLAVVCVLVAVGLYVFLPETRGTSLEDMATYFAVLTGDNSIIEAEAQLAREVETRMAGGDEGGGEWNKNDNGDGAGDGASATTTPAVEQGTMA